MAPLKIWGRLNSINVQKVVLTAEEIGIPYERVDAGMHFGITKTAEYLAMNPNARVPTIEDEGFCLWESNVIVRYLSAKYSPGTLWPIEPRARADVDRWMDWQQAHVNGPMTTLFWGLVRSPGSRSEEDIAAARTAMADMVKILEAQLDGREFIGGGHFTMADSVLAPVVHRWKHLPLERDPLPNIDRYYRNIMARPSAQKVLTLPLS